MRVEISQLFRIKARRRAANGIQRKPVNRLGTADHFIITMAPAKAEQIIEHGIGKIALIAVGTDTKRAMAFREFGPINAMNQRNMGKFGNIPAHAAIHHRLAKGVVEMIITPDHMGDAHVMIIDNDGQHIGGGAIGAQDDHVIKDPVLHGNLALNQIGDCRAALIRHFHAHNE